MKQGWQNWRKTTRASVSTTMTLSIGTHRQWRIQGGSGGSNEPPLEPKLFNFHGEFQEKLVRLHKSNPPQLIWTPDLKILDLPLTQALADSVNPDQTAPEKLQVWSGSTLSFHLHLLNTSWNSKTTFFQYHCNYFNNFRWPNSLDANGIWVWAQQNLQDTFTSACACSLSDQNLQDDVHITYACPLSDQNLQDDVHISLCMLIVWSKLTRWHSHQPVHAHCLIKTYKMTFTSACACSLSDQNKMTFASACACTLSDLILCMPIVWSKLTRWHSHKPVHAHCLIKIYKMTFTPACACLLSDQNLQDDVHLSLCMPIVWSKLTRWFSPHPVHAHCLIKLTRWRSHQPVHAHCLIKTYKKTFISACTCPLSEDDIHLSMYMPIVWSNLQDDVHISLCMLIVWSKLIRWHSH